ncbi:type IX secretion system membrane protein PorP/SprF [Aestuariivivens sp. NBU2969]|uniref:PorP/SprF family type IX secretion system membrane protein n=1 Tax=Aestuariivivens sp. NBU2969 TaxID=2873267 RepID=UPI001CBBA025|nr:type IX secretion system membrane protein PorP/SprF [Aestuariivivens sp. NBU2969]
MIKKLHKIKGITLIFGVLFLYNTQAQQEPQYTQYMYNTMVVNPAYAGQRETLNIVGLYRTQWVGVDGAPETQSLGIHSPINNGRSGLGLVVVNDALGPASEMSVNTNFSYTIPFDDRGAYFSFGFKAGFQQLKLDWSKGIHRDPDNAFNENLNLFSAVVGSGFYLYSNNWYLGMSIPNIITTKHYDDFQESVASERMHYYIIGGYVFDLSKTTKFKPAFLVKAVSGAPLIVDFSANMLFNEKLTFGLAWRWEDSISVLTGFQINKNIYLGYAYDLTTTGFNNYNSGTHEIMFRFELAKLGKLLSPRFF